MQIPELNNKIIVITGPTASGKSDVSLKLAKKINGYIINADSMQVYKELIIGTAQPTPDKIYPNKWKISGVDHYLFGYISIKRSYSISHYQRDVFKVMNLEENRKRTPILVGGSGLYIDSTIKCYELREEQDTDRNELLKKSVAELRAMLTKREELQLNESDINNPRRLIRVIERGIVKPTTKELPHKYYILDPGKEELVDRINARVDKMVELGLEEENKILYTTHSRNTRALKAIGYYEFDRYFQGHATIEQVIERIKIDTRQYAKRQRTWFNRKDEAIWFTSPDELYQRAINDFKKE